MAAMAQPIKSIDVGSMFLMDLALNDESEINCVATNNGSSSFSTTTTTTNHGCLDRAVQDTIFHRQPQDNRREQLNRSKPMDAISHHDNHSAASNGNGGKNLTTAQLAELDQLDEEDQDYIISYVHNQRGNYCRLFKNNQGSYLNSGLHSNLWNQVRQQQQPPPPLQHTTSNNSTGREHAGRSFSSSSSLSDLSLTASSDNAADDSSSGSVISYSVINHYAAAAADDDGHTSSTTRDEDSGIVRMIHLDNQQNIHNNSFDIDDCFQQQHQQQHQRFYNKVKPTFDVDKETIMMETEPTSDQARIHLNNSSYSERDNNKPTNNSHYHNNYSYRRGEDSRRTMSASLPIQVPPRQSDRDFKSSCEAAEASDFEEFLDQEYNRSSHFY